MDAKTIRSLLLDKLHKSIISTDFNGLLGDPLLLERLNSTAETLNRIDQARPLAIEAEQLEVKGAVTAKDLEQFGHGLLTQLQESAAKASSRWPLGRTRGRIVETAEEPGGEARPRDATAQQTNRDGAILELLRRVARLEEEQLAELLQEYGLGLGTPGKDRSVSEHEAMGTAALRYGFTSPADLEAAACQLRPDWTRAYFGHPIDQKPKAETDLKAELDEARRTIDVLKGQLEYVRTSLRTTHLMLDEAYNQRDKLSAEARAKEAQGRRARLQDRSRKLDEEPLKGRIVVSFVVSSEDRVATIQQALQDPAMGILHHPRLPAALGVGLGWTRLSEPRDGEIRVSMRLRLTASMAIWEAFADAFVGDRKAHLIAPAVGSVDVMIESAEIDDQAEKEQPGRFDTTPPPFVRSYVYPLGSKPSRGTPADKEDG